MAGKYLVQLHPSIEKSASTGSKYYSLIIIIFFTDLKITFVNKLSIDTSSSLVRGNCCTTACKGFKGCCTEEMPDRVHTVSFLETGKWKAISRWFRKRSATHGILIPRYMKQFYKDGACRKIRPPFTSCRFLF